MANYFARKAGNINATDVWATTPSGTAADVWSTFTSADVLHTNNFAITVNVSTTVGSVRNDNANGATNGGSLTLNNGVTLTANVFCGTVTCVTYGGLSGNSATINGNITGSTSGGVSAVNNTSSGTLNINGSVTAGSVGNATGCANSSTGTLVIVGNVTGGLAATAYGANNIVGGTVNITGTVTGSSVSGSGDGARNSSNGILNITGNCIGFFAVGANNASNGTTNITGNCTGGTATNSHGAVNGGIGTLNITGNVTGGSINTAFGVSNNTSGTVNVIGLATGSSVAVGAANASTGILNVKRAVGNGWGIGSVGLSSVAGVQSSLQSSQTRVEEFEFGALGQFPIAGAVSCPDLTTNVCIVHRLGTTKKTLVDSAASANYPAANNVRSGTSFNFGNTTGTLAVPAAGSVALGVAVDNTVGTAVLTPSAVWDALTSGMTTAGSIGERLKNAATVDTTGQALSDALSPVP